VAFFLVRTLRKDISYYNERLVDVGPDEEDGGWKLLHGDVFRTPPQAVSALCIAVGTGLQITVVLFLTILTAISGILPPMGKGQLVTAVLVLYVMSGSVAGYTSARLFKYFELTGWKIHTILTATAFPGLIMFLFLLLDICLAWAGASSAVSIWTILLLFVLWVGVASPLIFLGSYFGYRSAKVDNPCKTKQIARHIPMDRPWYTKAPYCCVAGGLLPFFSVLLEVYFIMEAVWLHRLYYVMAFLFGVFLILVTICAEISISLCYLQLNAEDHQWHWKAFLNSASFGGYLMAYSIWFAVGKMALVGFMPTIVYFTYMSIACLSLALFCGSVGFLSSLWFVRKIYGAVKVD
jgi:transmembrane 9 superfamily protein 2/4